jgi:hypothetical protein
MTCILVVLTARGVMFVRTAGTWGFITGTGNIGGGGTSSEDTGTSDLLCNYLMRRLKIDYGHDIYINCHDMLCYVHVMSIEMYIVMTCILLVLTDGGVMVVTTAGTWGLITGPGNVGGGGTTSEDTGTSQLVCK